MEHRHELTERQKFLSYEDMAALFEFNLQCEDSDADGYTVPKKTMRRLAELGVVNSQGPSGWYEVTAFGTWLIETEFEQNPSLPLNTVADHNELVGRKDADH